MKTIVQQLNDIYFNVENWHKEHETLCGITNYHQSMIDKGNLQTYCEDNELLGYYECWLIDKWQMERILNDEEFIAPFEDTIHGDIAYLANLWIVHDDRKQRVMKQLKSRFFEQTNHCTGWVGQEFKNKHRLRIFMNKGA